jgi:hypothetical protein
MLPDQAPKTGEGVWLKFFGRYAYTMTLAARLTETGAVAVDLGRALPAGGVIACISSRRRRRWLVRPSSGHSRSTTRWSP